MKNLPFEEFSTLFRHAKRLTPPSNGWIQIEAHLNNSHSRMVFWRKAALWFVGLSLLLGTLYWQRKSTLHFSMEKSFSDDIYTWMEEIEKIPGNAETNLSLLFEWEVDGF